MKKLKKLLFVFMVFAVFMPFIAATEVKEGTKVLIWTTKFSFAHASDSEMYAKSVQKVFNDAYGEKVTTDINIGYDSNVDTTIVRTTLEDLSDYSLVFLVLPSEEATDEEITLLQDYVDKGGRIVLIAEHNGYSKDANKVLSTIAKKLGADFYIDEGSYGGRKVSSERNKNSRLYATGVEQNYVAPIVYSGRAQWVFRFYSGEKEIPWVVDQASSKGRITVISDVNYVIDWYEKKETTDPVEFTKLLLEDSIDNMEIVKNGGNPNEEFGKGEFFPKTNNEKYKVKSEDLIKIIPLTDEEKVKVDNGEDVSVRLQVSESKEDVPEDAQKLIEKNLKKNTLAMYLDVSLFKKVGDGEETKLSVLADSIELSVDVDEKLLNKDKELKRVYKVLRTHEGKIAEIDADFNEETNVLTFKTDRFSSYALIYKDVPRIDNPKTGDGIVFNIVIGITSILGLGCIMLFSKKKLNN